MIDTLKSVSLNNVMAFESSSWVFILSKHRIRIRIRNFLHIMFAAVIHGHCGKRDSSQVLIS